MPLLLHLSSGPLTRGCSYLTLYLLPLCMTLRWRPPVPGKHPPAPPTIALVSPWQGVGHKGKIMPRLADLHSVDRGDLIAAIAKNGGLRKVAHHLGWRKQPTKKELAAAAVSARRRERGAPAAGKDG